MAIVQFIGIIFFLLAFVIILRVCVVRSARRRNFDTLTPPVPVPATSIQYVTNFRLYDVESGGVQVPAATHNHNPNTTNENGDPLPLYELPPTYEAIAKDGSTSLMTGASANAGASASASGAQQQQEPPYVDVTRPSPVRQ